MASAEARCIERYSTRQQEAEKKFLTPCRAPATPYAWHSYLDASLPPAYHPPMPHPPRQPRQIVTTNKGPVARDKPVKERIRPATRKACELIVHEGMSDKQAAEKAGITLPSLRQALQRPIIRKLMADLHRSVREGAHYGAFARIETLSAEAESENVKLRANEWIAGLGGLSPAQNVRIDARHTHSFQWIDDAIDVTPTPDDGE